MYGVELARIRWLMKIDGQAQALFGLTLMHGALSAYTVEVPWRDGALRELHVCSALSQFADCHFVGVGHVPEILEVLLVLLEISGVA